MKLLLIQPYNDLTNHLIEFVENFKSVPLALLRLATMTPSEFDVEIIDENVEKLTYKKADLVGISIHGHIVAERAYKMADNFRKRGIPVILGGIHPTIFPEESSKHADSVVIGEADEEWENILNDFVNGKLKKRYKCKKPDTSKIPPLRRKWIENKKYDFYNLIQTTRGCPIGCDFCLPCAYYGKKPRHKNISTVLKEIEIAKKVKRKKYLNKFFIITDDNILADKKYAKELFKALIPYKIRWGAQCSINIAQDDELLDLAYKSGCRGLFIGFESLNQDSLYEVNKKFNVKDYPNLIRKIKNRKIIIYASFVFGFKNENKNIFKGTLNFCMKNNLDLANFHILTPYYSTNIYKKLNKRNKLMTKKENIICEGNYTEDISSIRVSDILKIYKSFYSIKKILIRYFKNNLKMRYKLILLLSNLNFLKKINKVNLKNE